jgi:hypothetical protein
MLKQRWSVWRHCELVMQSRIPIRDCGEDRHGDLGPAGPPSFHADVLFSYACIHAASPREFADRIDIADAATQILQTLTGLA